ncbi:MAG: efflux RND transporter periplasmic adaptor subunit [Patescibacteria group bacterium]|nr:efflux RND transporter periplasmic adaptor subunit [Patescibacteria group bacterium]
MEKSIIEESKKARRGFWGKLIRSKIFLALLVILIGAVTYYLISNKSNQNNSEVIVQKQAVAAIEDLKISISASGKIVAKDGVELSFPVSGSLEVDSVYVNEGDEIKKGDKVASVKTESLNFELRSAYNNYQSALASYNSKVAPASDSEISKAKSSIEQSEASLEQAQLSLEQTKVSAANTIANAEASLKTAKDNLDLNSSIEDSEAVNNAYNNLLTNIKSVSILSLKVLRDSDSIIGVDDTNINSEFEAVLGAKNSTSFSSSKNSYPLSKNLAQQLESYLFTINASDHYAIDQASDKAKTLLDSLQSHLYNMQDLVDATITFVGLSQSKLDGFKSTISSNRSSVNSAISSLNGSLQSISTSKNSLSQYQSSYDKAIRDLDLAKSQTEQNIKNAEISLRSRELSLEQSKNDYADLIAPIDSYDLSSAKAQLTSAAISVDKAKYNVDQATLISPIDGVISQLNYKQGDIILSDSAKKMASIINKDTLFIEVNIEEADISKLEVGQKARASFDAVDDVELDGELSFISMTSETSSNGIVTYLVRILINDVADSPVREGMTASVDFITAEAQDVLAIPVAAIRNIAGSPSVEKEDGSIVNVVSGFTDGKKVEIISGLSAGDKIVY